MNTHRSIATFCCFIAAVFSGSTNSDAAREGNENGSRVLGGVVARFKLVNSALRPGEDLKVRLILENKSSSLVEFRYLSGSFAQHIRVYDAGHRQVPKRLNAPFFESAADKKSLRPAEKFVTITSIDVWQLYDLPPGTYAVRFYYDLRLIADQKLAGKNMKRYHAEDWILWDTKWYPFSVRQ